MRHRLFTICSALSLLLCAAACVLWVRCYFVADTLVWRLTNAHDEMESLREPYFYSDTREVVSARGGLQVYRKRVEVCSGIEGRWSPPALRHRVSAPPGPYPVTPHVLVGCWLRAGGGGFQLLAAADRSDPHAVWEWSFTAPYWALAAAAGLPAGLGFCRGLRRSRRIRRGLSPACGYDLRATPDRCPECGAAAAAGPVVPLITVCSCGL